ncbi:MAG: hypothetical protein AB8B91_10850 [Rubripirellula sp.]
MRIPSQFNEDSLYRRDKRSADSSQTQRRLIRLVVALALIVVVMKQARKPAVYRPFFGSQLAPHGGTAATQASITSLASESDSSAAPSEIRAEDRQIANQLVAALEPIDQRDWVKTLSRWLVGQSVEFPKTVDRLTEQLESLDLPVDQQTLWATMFQSLASQSDVLAGSEKVAAAAFLSALDDAAAARVVDGSVWRSGDFDALYRCLDQANQFSESGVASTAVLPLLQQPDVFRNQLVRVDGGVARAEKITAQNNVYGIKFYWQLWLRPSDGADRPLILIVPDAPSLVQAVGADATSEEGPQVVAIGKFLKRLAYRSSVGADLAPVVVGRLTTVPLTQQEVVADPANATNSAASGNRFWLTLLIACVAGVLFAAFAMYRTSVAAKRMRKLRTAHRKQPDEFLGDLNVILDRNEVKESP